VGFGGENKWSPSAKTSAKGRLLGRTSGGKEETKIEASSVQAVPALGTETGGEVEGFGKKNGEKLGSDIPRISA